VDCEWLFKQLDDSATTCFSLFQVDEVFAFLISLGPSVAAYAQMFRQQEIDGQALMLLHENHLMDSMGLKLGPALKLCAAVKDLKSCRL